MKKRGWIALDIDGTITLDKYTVPKQVSAFLGKMVGEGWGLVIATGRPFAFASIALSDFDFPYIFLGQNGALALEMPEKRILFKSYIPYSSVPFVEEAYRGIESDFLIYASYEQGDFCYWRPDRFPKDEFEYLAELQTRQKENWRNVNHFPKEAFPMIKCFGPKTRLDIIESDLISSRKFQVAKIRDSFASGVFLLLVTDSAASKGSSLSKVFEIKGKAGPVIAAGDDENDLSLLQAADVKIAMAHAPSRLQEMADLIAPPTHEQGIIAALKLVLEKHGY